MTLDEIKGLIDAMGSSDLSEMTVERDGWSLRLLRHPSAPSPTAVATRPAAARRPAATPKAVVQGGEICAPLAGIVYLSPSPDAPSFVTLGQTVSAGTVVCVVEAMKTFNEVRAERDGTVAGILIASGSEVEAGAPVIRLA